MLFDNELHISGTGFEALSDQKWEQCLDDDLSEVCSKSIICASKMNHSPLGSK